jgi:hypothetical protein
MAFQISDAIFKAKAHKERSNCFKVAAQFLVELLSSFLKHFRLPKTLKNWRRNAQNANEGVGGDETR